MADNTTLNTGTGGDVIATDDISGVKYQRVKLTLGADGVTNGDVSSSNPLPISDNSSSITVDNGGTFAVQAAQSGTWNITNVSGTVSLPTGAATSAKQPALGVAGTASSDVITVQGIASMTALKVDGSGVTQPVSGTVTANAGTGTMNVSVQNASIPVTDNGGSLTVDNGGTFAVQATQSGTWNVGLNAGSNAIGSITNTSFAATQATAANLNATVVGTGTFAVQAAQSGNYTVRNQDGAGNNLASSTTTPAGTEQALIVRNIPSGTQTVSGTVAATQSGTWTLGANSGVDIGDVTINNTQAQQVYVQMTDGTNSIPVDTAHNDGETNTENHIDVAAKGMHYNGTTWDRMRGDTTGTNQQGNIAHDSIDSGNPIKLGAKAIAHGTNPTAVAAADRTDLYSNRAGVLFTIGGHPNIITRTVYISDATGAQTDASIVGTIAAGTKVAVTSVAVTVDSATTATGGVAVKLGFGATTIPADSSTGANGILLDHKGIAAGSGMVLGSGAGLLGIGADGEELRLTCEDPVGGGLSVMFSYYTIES